MIRIHHFSLSIHAAPSPLKRHNIDRDSPRVQLEKKHRQRLLEQRQVFKNDGMVAGPSNRQQSQQFNGPNQWLTNQWMQDHYGGGYNKVIQSNILESSF